MVLKQMEQWALKWIAAVLAWLQTGWREPARTLRWDSGLYPLVMFAAAVVLVVKLTPVMGDQLNTIITSVGNSLNKLLNFSISA
ncbi:MAG: hypothetical protein IMX00_11455 [Limnochordales bacterium]|nr:hypothetical protein [Limnochordales bacterium]